MLGLKRAVLAARAQPYQCKLYYRVWYPAARGGPVRSRIRGGGRNQLKLIKVRTSITITYRYLNLVLKL
eukprot:SAG31_NODE_34814_length_329_cov_0.560870_1_plen_68_part_01